MQQDINKKKDGKTNVNRLLGYWDKFRNSAWNWGPFVFLIVIWQLVHTYGSVDPRLMPSFKEIIRQFELVLRNGMLLEYSLRTIKMLLISAVISTVVGYVIGLTLGLSERIASYSIPVLRYFNALPGIAWTPLFLVWFGFNEKTVLAVVMYTFLFPVIFNVMIGIQMVPKVYRNAILTMGGNRWTVIKDVLFQGSLANLITGIRTGFGYSWRAIIGAEILAGTGGLGYMIFQARSSGVIARIVAGMIVIGVIWTIMDRAILQPLEKSTIQRWALVAR
jgi:taurine transport system permease protein